MKKIFLILSITFLYGFNLGFFYNTKVPREFNLYNLVVVPNNVKKIRKNFIAYISLGENINPEKSWILGKNKNWNSYIVDIRNKNYQKYLINKIKHLKKFRGFFFDTLDSYKLILPKKQWKSYEKAEINFIKQVKKVFPHKIIILNRGFNIIKYLKKDVFAVIAEGMFEGYNGKHLTKTSFKERKWLIKKLRYVQSLGVKTVVVDYFNGTDINKAKEIAKKIKFLGFIPYVTNPDLNIIGISNLQIIKRKILVIYTSRFYIQNCDAHRLIQLPLEYMGYIVDIKTLKEAIKIKNVIDKYSGIIIVPEIPIKKNSKKFINWLKQRIKNKNKIVFLENFGVPVKDLSFLGIKSFSNKASLFEKFKIIKKSKIVGFESPIPPTLPRVLIYSKGGILVMKNAKNQLFSPISITKWGGYAINPYIFNGFSSDVKWIINPFKFLKKALRLKDFPKPDFTTENGMRVFFSHIDGDGATDKVDFDPKKIACEETKDAILEKYPIPIGVSFVVAAIEPYGVYPKTSKRVLKCVKETFALKNVEPASHTYSHPFFWRKAQKLEGYTLPKGYNLPIRNYKFSLYKEIVGSCKILSKLAPKNKPVKLIFWSGNCQPSAKALAIAYKHGILNINGGDTIIRKYHDYLSNIAPAGIKKGKYYQVYDAEQDEYIYTYGFTKNFWGYKNVIQTFKLTNKPRRLEPIDIYFHFYTTSKLAALNALKYVLDWCLKQNIIPLTVSEYIKKVLDFYHTVVGKEGNYWIVKTNGNIRTLRVNKNFDYPDIANSKGVVGWYDFNNQRYINLNGSGFYKIKFTKNKNQCRLIQSNARIIYTKHNFYRLKAWFQSVKLRISKECKLITNNKFVKKGKWIVFKKDIVNIRLENKH